jgi:hypothetical protein
MHELRADFNRMGKSTVAKRPDPSTNSIARLENERPDAALLERTHGRQAGDTGTHDGDVTLLIHCIRLT